MGHFPRSLFRAGTFRSTLSDTLPVQGLGLSLIRKILVSVKFLSAILGPEMAAPILWTPGKMRPFCRKNRVHKIPRFRGGGIWGFLGGVGEVPILFLWARGIS